jgi:hypothetical protein
MEELDFVVYNNPVYCINLSNNFTDDIKFKLIELMFYKKHSFVHFHSNMIDNEKMLILSGDILSRDILSEDIITDNLVDKFAQNIKPYHQIQIINTNSYLDDIGLVSKISSLFSRNNISILYITTCQNNFIFVEEKDLEPSIKLLYTLTKNVKII